MTTEEEIADIERRLSGMSHGDINFVPLNQRLLTLHAAQKNNHDSAAEQAHEKSENQWHKKPLGLIFVGVAIGTLTTCATYLLAVYFGVRLDVCP